MNTSLYFVNCELMDLANAFDKFLNCSKWQSMIKSGSSGRKNIDKFKILCSKSTKFKEKGGKIIEEKKRYRIQDKIVRKRCCYCHKSLPTKSNNRSIARRKIGMKIKLKQLNMNDGSKNNNYMLKKKNSDGNQFNNDVNEDESDDKTRINEKWKTNYVEFKMKKNKAVKRNHKKIERNNDFGRRNMSRKGNNIRSNRVNPSRKRRGNDFTTQIPPTTPGIFSKNGIRVKKREKFTRKDAMARINRRNVYKPKAKPKHVIPSGQYLVEPSAKKRNKKILNKSVEHIFKEDKK